MKKLLLVFLFLSLGQIFGQTKQDTLGIKKAALDYVEGWLSGDMVRVKSAVSPELAKRRFVNVKPGLSYLSAMTASTLAISSLGNKDGVRMKDYKPDEKLQQKIVIFDIDGTNATAKTWNEKYNFFDYLHLAKDGDKWIIINVLWDMNSQ